MQHDDDTQPATKGDLRVFATKEDLNAFATKEDLNGFATKYDLQKFATKEDLHAFATRKDIRTVQESIDQVLSVVINIEKKFSAKFEDQGKRIRRLESKVG